MKRCSAGATTTGATSGASSTSSTGGSATGGASGTGTSSGGLFSGEPTVLATGTVDADGGVVQDPTGNLLQIPTGALSAPVAVIMQTNPQAPALPTSATALATPISFSPDGTTFQIPVLVRLTYNPALIPAGETVTVLAAPAGSSDYVDLGGVAVNGLVTTSTTHFSNYVAAALDVVIDRIPCDPRAGAAVCGDAGVCFLLAFDPNNCGACGNVCPNGMICSYGTCGCQAGQVMCNGQCVDPTFDDDLNCGSCNHSCEKVAVGDTCQTGECGCTLGQVCDGVCTTLSDPKNCGGCGNVCGADSVCAKDIGFTCQTTCQNGLTACPGSASCVNLMSDPQNCGSCGSYCPAGTVCATGTCVVDCASGLTACGTECVSLSTSDDNCGRCGNQCPSQTVCEAGSCVSSCPTGTTNCLGACVDLGNSPLNCGACGMACHLNQVCNNGICGCAAGLTSCSNRCVDTTYDVQNCGACGVSCRPGVSCVSGVCGGTGGGDGGVSTPDGGASDGGFSMPDGGGGSDGGSCAGIVCAGGCTDPFSDPNNCGGCGVQCPVGEGCSEGVCGGGGGPGPDGGEGEGPDGGQGEGGMDGGGSGGQCPGLLCPSGCVDPTSDPSNCGGCSVVCPAGDVCANSQCISAGGSDGGGSCPAGEALCSGMCTSLATDPTNCGACGVMCGLHQICANGACM